MYSGFITTRRTLPAVGVHQRFDRAAYRLAKPYVVAGDFPERRQIIHFEGLNGPDGLKTKSPGHHDPGHLYDPATGRGDIPHLIEGHYGRLVAALQDRDQVRAAFEAAWLAHYITDGLTPAHHFPLDTYMETINPSQGRRQHFIETIVAGGSSPRDMVRRNWALWGGKGVLTTHFNFELGVATALVGHRIRAKLDLTKLALARRQGPVAFFREEAAVVASLQLYERFSDTGWTAELGLVVRQRLVPQTVQAIAIMWLLAYLEAGFNEAVAA